MRPARIKQLNQLASLRKELAAGRESEQTRVMQADTAAVGRRREPQADFRHEKNALGVKRFVPSDRARHAPIRRPPRAASRARDDAAALAESRSAEIDVDSLLDTDETLSFRRPGISPDTLRRLRRGEWSIQDQLDLHGHRIDEARHALTPFLRDALKRGLRCVRVVHGKGLGSKDRMPVLKNKVRAWLSRRDEVIAFCQARAAEGGSGAIVVLLRAAA